MTIPICGLCAKPVQHFDVLRLTDREEYLLAAHCHGNRHTMRITTEVILDEMSLTEDVRGFLARQLPVAFPSFRAKRAASHMDPGGGTFSNISGGFPPSTMSLEQLRQVIESVRAKRGTF